MTSIEIVAIAKAMGYRIVAVKSDFKYLHWVNPRGERIGNNFRDTLDLEEDAAQEIKIELMIALRLKLIGQ